MNVFKTYLAPALSLFVICLVMTALLGLTNSVTAPKISQIAADAEDSARLEVFEEAEGFGDSRTVTLDSVEYVYYDALGVGGAEIGQVFTTAARSYGGELKVMTGVDSDGRVTGVEILEIADTPGMGMNAKKPEWLSRFVGKSADIAVSKKGAVGNEIDAISGATISSEAVVQAVNTALELAAAVKGGAQNG